MLIPNSKSNVHARFEKNKNLWHIFQDLKKLDETLANLLNKAPSKGGKEKQKKRTHPS